MKWIGYLFAVIVCLNPTGPASAQLTLGETSGTPRLVTISPGPTQTAAGDRLLAALAAIDDASALEPYVIILAPGEYDIGGDSLIMKSHVSLRGSSRKTTRVIGTNVNYLVRTASYTDISSLSLENQGGTNRARAIYSNGVVDLAIRDVDVYASNATGAVVGIENVAASPVIRNVTVHASGIGSAGVDGISNQDGASPSIWDTNVLVTVPDGGIGSGIKGHTDCAPDIYDVYVKVSVTGAGRGQGLYFFGNCNPRIKRVWTEISGGSDIIGIFNSKSSYLTLQDVVVVANGKGAATETYGIKCVDGSTLDMERGHVGAYGAETLIGVEGAGRWWDGSGTLSINRGTVDVRPGGTSIRTAVGLTIRVASTVITGPIDNWLSNPFTCVNSVDGNYNPLDADCMPLP